MSDPKLPSSWYEISLKDVCRFVDYRGKTPVKTTSGVPLITAKNIKDGYINPDPKEYISEDSYDDWMTRGIPKFGDVVITTEAPMGNVAVIKIKEKFAMAQRAICLQFGNDNTSYFVHYALRSPFFQQKLKENATGTTVNGIKSATLKELEIPFPPMSEQKIIADKLDDLLARVDSIKTRLENIPKILKKFRQSVLSSIIIKYSSGKNYKEQFSTSLGSISEDIRYGTSKKCSETEGDTAVLRIPNIGSGHIIDSNLKYAYFDEKELSTLSLKKGDLLLIRSNGSVDLVGKVAMVSEKDTGFLYAGYLIRIRLNLEIAVPEYVTYCLQSPQIRQVIENIARSTSGVNNINSKELSSLILPIPSLEEQNEIIKDVDKHLSCISIFETTTDNALSRINNLTQSILAKAFRGELTAQWREENPELISGLNSAEALLEKITAEKLAAGTIKKRAKKTSH